MRLHIQTNKHGSQNFYVLKSFRDSNGKSTTKIAEKLGNYEELSKVHEDPVAWAKAYVAELNRIEQEAMGTVQVTFHQRVSLEKDSTRLFNGGYLFLQKIYHDLRLDYVCSRISSSHEFEFSLNRILQRLLYGRILSPTSKVGTYEFASTLLEAPNFELHDVYRALSVLAEESDFIQSQVYKFSKDLGKRNDKILYYDCTNYYFEIEQASGIRQYGISKEHRPNPIVEMGLFMDGDGIPLAFCLHSGNTNEQKTMIPLEKQIISDFAHSKFITCTDAGLASNANRKFNSQNGRAFITTQSIKKMKDFQKKWALDTKGWRLCGSDSKKEYDLDILFAEDGSEKLYEDKLFYKESWFKENGIEQKYIVSFSSKYKQYQRSVREQQIQRAKKALSQPASMEHSRQTDYKRMIRSTSCTEAGEVAEKKSYYLDEELIHAEEQYDGFYAVATDLEDSAETIVALNKRRWEIEECFRIMKTEFSARPVYLSRDDRIKAHFLTCFLALILYRYLERKLDNKYTCPEILDTLANMNFLKIDGTGYIPTYTRTDLTDALHSAFGFRTDTQIVGSATMKKIIAQTKTRDKILQVSKK